MSKKILVKTFLPITILLMIVVASCSNDNDEVLNNTIQSESASGGETMLVSFTLEQPVMQTRAFSDGLTATTLTYAVYKAGDRNCILKSEDEVTFTGRVATVDIRLEKEQNYDILFWADAPNVDCYTFDENAQTITVNYSGIVSGYEVADAFYAAEKNLYVDPDEATGGVINKTVILTRPFAQLNIGTTDYNEPTLINTYTGCSVRIRNVNNVIDLYTGVVSNTSSFFDAEAVFTYANFIGAVELFPVTVTGVDIEYLSMHYLLVPEYKTLTEVTIAFRTVNGTEDVLSQKILEVPLQRNYRTNLYGNFFTAEAEYNVIIDSDYETPDYDEEYNVLD